MSRFLKVVLACVALTASPVHAVDELSPGDAAAGRIYAIEACSSCHDIANRRSLLFSLVGPPDFYAVANAKTTTLMGLNVFLVSQHRSMPNFIIADEDRRNVIAHIMSLRQKR